MNELLPGASHSGDVLLDGESIYAPGVDVVDLRRRVGMVFQKSNPFAKSIFENVAYGLRVAGEKDKTIIAECVEESLADAALWDEVKERSTRQARAELQVIRGTEDVSDCPAFDRDDEPSERASPASGDPDVTPQPSPDR